MATSKYVAASLALTVLSLAGCKHTDTTALAYANAINTFYTAHPTCVWPEPVKFPLQVDTKKSTETAGYDALVDQGLLLRSTAEKPVFIIGSKLVTIYDLNPSHSAWVPDPTQPGFGNFCYGHRNVQTIDTATPATTQPGSITQVTYHYKLVGTPAWAQASETQAAFPQVAAELGAPPSAAATLINTTTGWQMKPPPQLPPVTPDGKLIE